MIGLMENVNTLIPAMQNSMLRTFCFLCLLKTEEDVETSEVTCILHLPIVPGQRGFIHTMLTYSKRDKILYRGHLSGRKGGHGPF